MSKKDSFIKQDGIVQEALPGLLFRVSLEGEREVLAHLGGKMKLNRIRVIPGDRVTVEMTTYDERRGRIVRRL
ncbi:MAG: translation initiation factor IF-1 [Candidatus Paceibacterota bacterium]|jgi:translation initiation factor IF-1